MNEHAEQSKGDTKHVANNVSQETVREANARVLERVRQMTPQQGFQSLVSSGIYTTTGQLAKEYAR